MVGTSLEIHFMQSAIIDITVVPLVHCDNEAKSLRLTYIVRFVELLLSDNAQDTISFVSVVILEFWPWYQYAHSSKGRESMLISG